jgi:hypothetical protein
MLKLSAVAGCTAAGLWGDETIYQLVARHVQTMPHAWAVHDRHRRLRYVELVTAADRLAAHLARHGVRPGQRVAVWLPSWVETAIPLLACSRTGYVCCPSLHGDHTVGDVVALVDPMRRGSDRANPAMCRRRPARRLCRIGRPCLPALHVARRSGEGCTIRRVAEPCTRNRNKPDTDQVMYLPFTARYDERTEGRGAQRQHAARHGADMILGPLGGAIFGAAVRWLAWCDRLVVIGFAASTIPTLRANYLLVMNIEIDGLQISDYRKRRPAQVAACFSEISSLLETGEGQARDGKTLSVGWGGRGARQLARPPHCRRRRVIAA